MNMDGKTVIVAGLGVSGQSMMEVLGSRAGRVLGVDEKKPDADLHSFDQIDWDNTDMVMTSPVFNPRTPFILEAQKRNIPVMSEVELAWQLRVNSNTTGKPAQWIGITGTNGKTSTTEMTSEMLTACGLAAPAVGNIGKAVSHAAVDPANDVLCVELSSFQLHFTYSLELDCAAITNIADDHLDWHGGIENYAATRRRCSTTSRRRWSTTPTTNASPNWRSRPRPRRNAAGSASRWPSEGRADRCERWLDRRHVRHCRRRSGKAVPSGEVTDFTHLTEPDGTVYPHLLADALTALALVLGLGADKDKALAALKQFTPGGHRIQTVAVAKTSDGGTIRFVDDSKATNAHAAKASLNSFADKSVVWIAGGLAKGSRFEQLVADQAHTIKAAIIIGKDQQPMLDAFKQALPTFPCPSSIPRTTTPSWPAPSMLPAPTRNPAMWCSWLRPARPWTSSSRTPIAETSSRSRLSVG